ncbi:hypothetical protein HXA35_01395 [Bacillus sp. A301a_S52]|nr:hypothetical protein [Bacillus sp. A301a_S52]
MLGAYLPHSLSLLVVIFGIIGTPAIVQKVAFLVWAHAYGCDEQPGGIRRTFR